MKSGDVIISKSDIDTERYGFEFANLLRGGDTIFLIGDLGSGKTTFVKGVAKGLGIHSRIISPTFIVVRRHSIEENHRINPTIHNFYHLDLYRMESEGDVRGVDLKEYLADENGIVAIEWPQVGQGLVDKKAWNIKFEYLAENNRQITFHYE